MNRQKPGYYAAAPQPMRAVFGGQTPQRTQAGFMMGGTMAAIAIAGPEPQAADTRRKNLKALAIVEATLDPCERARQLFNLKHA